MQLPNIMSKHFNFVEILNSFLITHTMIHRALKLDLLTAQGDIQYLYLLVYLYLNVHLCLYPLSTFLYIFLINISFLSCIYLWTLTFCPCLPWLYKRCNDKHRGSLCLFAVQLLFSPKIYLVAETLVSVVISFLFV